MKNIAVLFVFLTSAIGFLFAGDPPEDLTIIKQPEAMEILYAVSAADPQGPRLNIASIFEAYTKTTINDGVVLEPGLFIQEGEFIQDGMLAYTGTEPIYLYIQSAKGREVFPVFPGEAVAVGSGPELSELYCDYCRCICSPNTPAKTITSTGTGVIIGIDPLPVGSNYAYFPWNGILDCANRENERCITSPGEEEGTMSDCKKISRKCL